MLNRHPVSATASSTLTLVLARLPQIPTIVACDQPHGGEVIAVYELPDTMSSYPGVGNAPTGVDEASTACLGQGDQLGDFGTFAGDNSLPSPKTETEVAGAYEAWLISSLEAAVFVPRPRAWIGGARWAVCAAVLVNSNKKLTSYGGSARGVLVPGGLPVEFGWCRSAVDETAGQFDIVACDEPHTTEQLASFRVVGDDAAFPGEDTIDRLAGRLCPELASVATAGRSSEANETEFGISWTYPQEQGWSSGERVARCFINTLGEPTTGTFTSNGE